MGGDAAGGWWLVRFRFALWKNGSSKSALPQADPVADANRIEAGRYRNSDGERNINRHGSCCIPCRYNQQSAISNSQFSYRDRGARLTSARDARRKKTTRHAAGYAFE